MTNSSLSDESYFKKGNNSRKRAVHVVKVCDEVCWPGMSWNEEFGVRWRDREADGHAAVGAEGDFGEVVDGDGAGGDEDGVGLGEFVEEGEEFEFDLEVVGEGIDEEVGGADGGFDGLGEEEIGEWGRRG